MDTIPEVDCAAAIERRDQGARWVDVREADEWEEAHIPGTHHMPLAGALEAVQSRWSDTSTPLVVSCKSGGRSGRLVSALREAGYTDVHNVRGGITTWVAEGRPVEIGRGRISPRPG